MDLTNILRHVPNYPKKGIDFIDITTVLQNRTYFHEAIMQMMDKVSDLDFDLVVGSESRGFIMGAPLAYSLGKGFIPVRKKGKLPAATVEASYTLEYGEDTLAMHQDAIAPGQRVLIVDDLLATGGTAGANCELVEKLGGKIVSLLFFIELSDLNGRAKLGNYRVDSVIKTEEIPSGVDNNNNMV